jgi:AcrR family transcriptional regulator
VDQGRRTRRLTKRVDARVAASRRALHGAIVRLTLEHGWDAVTVRDVCRLAGVGRSTFYAHFADKEELLVGGLDDVREALRGVATGRAFAFLPGLLAHVDDSRRLFRAVIGKHSGLAVQRRFRAVVLDLVRDELDRVAISDPYGVVARYVAGALVELLVWWVDARPSLDAAALAAEFLRLTEPVLAGSRTVPRRSS